MRECEARETSESQGGEKKRETLRLVTRAQQKRPFYRRLMLQLEVWYSINWFATFVYWTEYLLLQSARILHSAYYCSIDFRVYQELVTSPGVYVTAFTYHRMANLILFDQSCCPGEWNFDILKMSKSTLLSAAFPLKLNIDRCETKISFNLPLHVLIGNQMNFLLSPTVQNIFIVTYFSETVNPWLTFN